MTSYISAELRRLVINRANSVCEYCRIHESDTFWGCQVDHIISEKHGGASSADNLALACTFCNRAKGSDIGSIAPSSQELTRFFNPRTDAWNDHFRLEGARIASISVIGEVTALILEFNTPERLLEREVLLQLGRYPITSH